MSTPNDEQELKWGDSFDLLSDERKQELRNRLESWDPDAAADDHLGPFAGERLNGLEVYWLAACALAGKDGDAAIAAIKLTAPARPSRSIRGTVSLPSLCLGGAYLSEISLRRAQLHGADLRGADLRRARLYGANLSEANLRGAHLRGAQLFKVNLSEANLCEANLIGAELDHAYLNGADLYEANLSGASLIGANLRGADLSGARLIGTNFTSANLSGANLSGADLSEARLVETELLWANLTGCKVYGISVWNARLDETIQANLRITPDDEPDITVDDLEVAQFLYLMLNNTKIRQVIDTIARKLVLILGRFTSDRKPVLDEIRNDLRRRNYLPVVFDFDKPASRDLTETVSTLAHMARFIIADLTDAKSISQELTIIVPNLPSVAIQPIIQADQDEYGMFEHWQRFPWVLAIYHYQNLDTLLAALADQVIAPAEQRANEIAPRK